MLWHRSLCHTDYKKVQFLPKCRSNLQVNRVCQELNYHFLGVPSIISIVTSMPWTLPVVLCMLGWDKNLSKSKPRPITTIISNSVDYTSLVTHNCEPLLLGMQHTSHRTAFCVLWTSLKALSLIFLLYMYKCVQLLNTAVHTVYKCVHVPQYLWWW